MVNSTFYMVNLNFYVVNSTFFYGQLDFSCGQLYTFYVVKLYTFYVVTSTFYMVNYTLFIWSTRLFMWSTWSNFYVANFFYGHLYLTDNALRALKLNQTKMAANNEDVQHISSACAIATQALEAIGNLQSSEIWNLAASTVTNSALNGSNLPTSSSLIAAELGRRFPPFNARGGKANRKRPSMTSMTHEKKAWATQ